MHPGVDAADSLSIDHPGSDSIAPEPAAKVSPVARLDVTSDPVGGAPIERKLSRRLLVGSGLAGSALAIALAIAAIPGTSPRVPAASPQLGTGALVEPPAATAASPSVDPASTRGTAPTLTAQTPASTERAAGKSWPVKPRGSTNGVMIASGARSSPGGQRPPGQGSSDQPPARPAPAAEGTVTSTSAPPSAVFGANR
jgi:hypothetical protein